MLSKNEIKKLLSNNFISKSVEKLTKGYELTFDEKVCVLELAILFTKIYEKDRRQKQYIEFAYYLILKYSIFFDDYEPLYDFSLNFGFYPISSHILKHEMLGTDKLQNLFNKIGLGEYEANGYTQTQEQYNTKEDILNSDNKEISFIAPTSFGKSSIIKDIIKKNNDLTKIAIIVPSKSLLSQLYNDLKKISRELGFSLLIHDEMYNESNKFIAVLTQERALRLIDKQSIEFDLLFIDEAHKLFDKIDDSKRVILLTRLLRKNINSKIVYLSPLIEDSNNLRINNEQNIKEFRINSNMKELNIFLRNDSKTCVYNRFLNKFYEINKSNQGYIDYIKETSKGKNFIYLPSPQKIEKFSKKLANNLNSLLTNDADIIQITTVLENYVHKDYYLIPLLKKGVIYLHGKIPDSIKEYLESKFKKLSEIKYLVANTVVLEGINFPIESAYILNISRGGKGSPNLKKTDLINLVGRVNRLNDIFSDKKESLERLLPNIHFVDCEYSHNRRNIEKLIKENLSSSSFTDNLENPFLVSSEDIIKAENQEYIEIEKLFLNEQENSIKKVLLKNNIAWIYQDLDVAVENIATKLQKINLKLDVWSSINIIDKLYILFIYGENILNDEISRLDRTAARNFYKFHIDNKDKSLKERVNIQIKYFNDNKKENPYFYMGHSFGEISKFDGHNNVYVNIKEASEEKIANLAIIKIKLEDDFLSYKLLPMIEALFELDLIEDDEYYTFKYGSNNPKVIELIKLGLPLSVINKLSKENQLEKIFVANGMLEVTEDFNEYRKTLDDFLQFQLNKFL
ncbi:DEAD/DEAH box helicase [Francisella philomiragia]|uniref:DEAD/DEAH box helicase n=1 Tax=Francisella philomiragia TaxID=28110 RepID=A0ABS1GAL0_9GAMM|nr:DEAD/DEAH box helicase [Francisella philomiragia]MBK2258358.1 DEAD/DEAH box helicase [Francisella philomiragia]MBK2301844.1 DEAD/DEAH box helicase [Francisella philomiragia]